MLALDWVVRLAAAGVLLQTLYFKFTAAPESVFIFTRLGMEPWGRLGTGLAELVAAALLLWTPTAAIGGVISAGLMSGAILSHLTRLGIEIQGDGGLLFGLACLVWLCAVATVVLHATDLPFVGAAVARRSWPGVGL